MAHQASENLHQGIFTPKEYQVELLSAALNNNVIICLTSHSAKSFVALMLIKELSVELRSHPQNGASSQKKLTIFLASTPEFAIQEGMFLSRMTDLNIGTVTESYNVLERSFLETHDVLVITISCFLHLLQNRLLQPSQINLLIVDDCYNAVEGHPMFKIMGYFNGMSCNSNCRILGLAPSILNYTCEPHEVEECMIQLEKTLGCTAETASDITSVLRFSSKCKEYIVVYNQDDSEGDLSKELYSIVHCASKFLLDHKYDLTITYGEEFQDIISEIPDPTKEPQMIFNDFFYILNSLGPICADIAALQFLFETEKLKKKTPHERHYLLLCVVFTTMLKIRATYDCHVETLTIGEKLESCTSPKLKRLLEILDHFKPKLSTSNVPKTNDVISQCNNALEPYCNPGEVLHDDHSEDCSVSNDSAESPVSNDGRNSAYSCSVEPNGSGDLVIGHEVRAHDECAGETSMNCDILETYLQTDCGHNKVMPNVNKENQTSHSIYSSLDHSSSVNKNLSENTLFKSVKEAYCSKNKSHTAKDEEKKVPAYNPDDPSSLCGIIFVEKRCTAKILYYFFKELSKHNKDYKFISPQYAVGPIIRADMDPKEIEIEHRKQEEVLRRFRMRECNLLISTNILEDGVDIPKCNLVIRFDAPNNFISYVNSKGRARSNDSYYILMLLKDEVDRTLNSLSSYYALQEILLEKCYCHEVPTDEEIDTNECLQYFPSYSPTKSASVSITTAISLVNRYCARLPSDTFTRLTPIWHVESCYLNDKMKYSCTLQLPINSPVKEQIKGPFMDNSALAKMAAALKTCVILHKYGELDDNLQPVGKETIKWQYPSIAGIEEEVLCEGTPRPGTTKRRQYYYKKVSDGLRYCVPVEGTMLLLYKIQMVLTYPIPDEQNIRGRQIYAPESSSRSFGILTSKPIPNICTFPIFTRSGEVSVELLLLSQDLILGEKELARLQCFHTYTFSKVLRLEKYPMVFDLKKSDSTYLIVPLLRDENTNEDALDWDFVKMIHGIQDTAPKNLTDEDRKHFQFDVSKYQDAVVMPWYRNQDQPQYFYVAEICTNLSPTSDFPDAGFETFEKYYLTKYNIQIQNLGQCLLDVDLTSARLNLLTPRYVNRKGVALPTCSEETKRAKRENLRQKVILVPELCSIHPFPASLWRKAVCLPCILYRINCLLLSDQLRVLVSQEIGLGSTNSCREILWPPLDFGWNLADVLRKRNEKMNKIKGEISPDNLESRNDEILAISNIEEGSKTVVNIVDEDKDTNCEEIDDALCKHNNLNLNQEREFNLNQSKAIENDFVDIAAIKNSSCISSKVNFNPFTSDKTSICLGTSDLDHTAEVCIGQTDTFEENNSDKLLENGLENSIISTDDLLVNLVSNYSVLNKLCSNGCDSQLDSDFSDDENILTTCADKPISISNSIDQLPNLVQPNDGSDITDGQTEENAIEKRKSKTILDREVIKGMMQIGTWSNDMIISQPQDFELDDLDPNIMALPTNLMVLTSHNDLEVSSVKETGWPTNIQNGTRIRYGSPSNFEIKGWDDMFDGPMYGYSDIHSSFSDMDNFDSDGDDDNYSDENNYGVKIEFHGDNIAEAIETNTVSDEHLLSWPQSGTQFEWNAENEELLNNLLKKHDDKISVIKDKLQTSSKFINCDQRLSLEIPLFKSGLSYDTDLCSELEDCNSVEQSGCDVFLEWFVEKKTANVASNFVSPVIPANPNFDAQPDLSNHPGPSPSIILTALTMSNANDGINLERLETIGDSFLKYAITAYLYCVYPYIHEGKLSYLRSKQVSNLNLYRLGRKKGLGEWMVATKFEPHENWLPPGYYVPKELEQALIESGVPTTHWNMAELPDFRVLPLEEIKKVVRQKSEQILSRQTGEPQVETASSENPSELPCFIPYNLLTQHSIPDKSIADCVEALIGAYLISCGARGALLFMSWLGLQVLPEINVHPEVFDAKNIISFYGELWQPPSPLLFSSFDAQETLKNLLSGYDKFESTINYKFRDPSYLLQAFTHASYYPNRLTDCYQRLEFLGDAVLDYLITRHLYDDKRQHSPGALTDLRSALVNNTIFASLAVKYDFHKYFKHFSPGLGIVIEKFVAMQIENGHRINEEYYFLEEEECEEAEDIEVPKALGDVFESVAGAIFLDSGKSLDAVWSVYHQMMKSEIEQFSANVPKSPIRELLEMEPETAKFGKPERLLDGKRVRVAVEIFGKGTYRGIGRNYRIAKSTAAKCALRALKKQKQNCRL